MQSKVYNVTSFVAVGLESHAHTEKQKFHASLWLPDYEEYQRPRFLPLEEAQETQMVLYLVVFYPVEE
jgi:hypothetical protein